jgi:RNA polymerase sigma-70 factor, ECF subfamily
LGLTVIAAGRWFLFVRYGMDHDADQTIWYTQQVIAWQPRLYGFILSLTGNPADGDDVLQNANVTLLRKQKEFQRGADFGPWAMQIAHYEVRRYWESCARARRRFDDVVLDQLVAKMREMDGEPDVELQFLRDCLSRLSAAEQEMLVFRYSGNSVGEVAKRCGRTAGSVSQTLYRIRIRLAECVRRALTAERRHER